MFMAALFTKKKKNRKGKETTQCPDGKINVVYPQNVTLFSDKKKQSISMCHLNES